MLVNDVVADVVAVLKHPEFRVAACLSRYTLPLFRRHKPVAPALDHQQRTPYFLRYPQQVELLQLVECVLLARSFEAVYHCFAAYHRTVFEIGSLVVRTTIFNCCL